MAAIENLEIVVEVDISDAISNLKALKEELESVAREIKSLRREGARGITIKTEVESIIDDLAHMQAIIDGFEAGNTITIGSEVNLPRNLPNGGGGGGGGGSVGLFGALRGIGDGDGMRETLGELKQSFSQMAEESSLTNINMADMHNVMARLIPLLLVFVGAIPAAYTALFTLAAAAASAAAAFAAMGAFGALGFAMEGGEFGEPD